jgi:phosphinothricin acetyltransferase
MPANQNAGITIRDAVPQDGGAIAAIYNYYITDTIVTFEEVPVDGVEIARRIGEVKSASLPWLVAERDGEVVGYCYAAQWKPRFGYRFTVEITVYVARGCEGQKLGSRLYDELFKALEMRGIHTVIGGIALPNDASIALHEKMGMKKVAQFESVGVKFDRWIDVGYWERILGNTIAQA